MWKFETSFPRGAAKTHVWKWASMIASNDSLKLARFLFYFIFSCVNAWIHLESIMRKTWKEWNIPTNIPTNTRALTKLGLMLRWTWCNAWPVAKYHLPAGLSHLLGWRDSKKCLAISNLFLATTIPFDLWSLETKLRFTCWLLCVVDLGFKSHHEPGIPPS